MKLYFTQNLWASDLKMDFLRLWAAARSLASLTFVVSASPVSGVPFFSFSREYAALKSAWRERKQLKIGGWGFDIDYLW